MTQPQAESEVVHSTLSPHIFDLTSQRVWTDERAAPAETRKRPILVETFSIIRNDNMSYYIIIFLTL